MIRKEAWPFHRTRSGVRLCWELEEPKGPKIDVAVTITRRAAVARHSGRPAQFLVGLEALARPDKLVQNLRGRFTLYFSFLSGAGD